MQKAMNFNNVAIASIKGSDYRIPFWCMSKNDTLNIMKNSNLDEKSGSLSKHIIIYKNGWNNNYQRNRETIDYYENNKEVLTERAKNKYRDLSEEKK